MLTPLSSIELYRTNRHRTTAGCDGFLGHVALNQCCRSKMSWLHCFSFVNSSFVAARCGLCWILLCSQLFLRFPPTSLHPLGRCQFKKVSFDSPQFIAETDTDSKSSPWGIYGGVCAWVGGCVCVSGTLREQRTFLKVNWQQCAGERGRQREGGREGRREEYGETVGVCEDEPYWWKSLAEKIFIKSAPVSGLQGWVFVFSYTTSDTLPEVLLRSHQTLTVW